MKRFARALRRARREHRDAREGRRAEALLRRRRRRATPPGRSTSSPAASRARSCRAACCARSPAQRAGIDDWLFDACYQAVGDFAETVAHVLPPPRARERRSASPTGSRSACCRCAALAPRRAGASASRAYWDELDTAGRFLLNKLIGGGFRVGVSKLLVQRALAEARRLDAKLVAQRMMGYTDAPRRRRAPSATAQLTRERRRRPARRRPAVSVLPRPPARCAASPSSTARLGAPADWIVEWKYDGIRAQVVKRAGQVWIWSRGEELVTERFPEIVALRARAARRHRARRRDRRLEGRPRRAVQRCCSSASAARR